MLSFLKTNIKIIFFLLCYILLSSTGLAAPKAAYKGVINSFKLNIREAPSNHSKVIGIVEKGEAFDIIDQYGGVGGWAVISYKGHKGYIRNKPKYIKLVLVSKDRQISEKSRKIQEEIRDQERIVETFSQKEVEIIEGLNEIDYALNKARKKALALSKEINCLEEKIAQLNQDAEKLSKDIDLNSNYTGKRLEALYKINMMGKLNLVGPPSSIFDFLLQQNAMKKIINSDYVLLEEQNQALKKLSALRQETQKEIRAKNTLETNLNEQIRMNKKETMKKELILKQIRKKKELSLAAIDALKNAAVQLDNQVNSLSKSSFVHEDINSFSNHKGQLILPVTGQIVSEFGSSGEGNYKSFTFQKGIDIKVEKGEPIKSVFKGKIMFAQWLNGYGNLLIIDHGDKYYTLYAHVEEIFKEKGETVETGEVIATAGDTGSIKGTCLHFELRHHGKPINPMKWLKKGA